MFNREERRQKRAYREKLKDFKRDFRKAMLDSNWVGADIRSHWNIMNLEATAIMMDEATTLSRLTRCLIVLSAILSALTVVLAYPIITNLLG